MNRAVDTYMYVYTVYTKFQLLWMPIPQQLVENKAIWSQGVYFYWRRYFVCEGRKENFV